MAHSAKQALTQLLLFKTLDWKSRDSNFDSGSAVHSCVDLDYTLGSLDYKSLNLNFFTVKLQTVESHYHESWVPDPRQASPFPFLGLSFPTCTLRGLQQRSLWSA